MTFSTPQKSFTQHDTQKKTSNKSNHKCPLQSLLFMRVFANPRAPCIVVVYAHTKLTIGLQ